MAARTFAARQIAQIREHGCAIVFQKLRRLGLEWPAYALLCAAAVPVVLVLRLLRPWFLVRLCGMEGRHIGHLAADVELYLCERDAGINVPRQRHADLCFVWGRPICNAQLVAMWRRVLRIWPAWLLARVVAVNRWLPGGAMHEVGANAQGDRDVHNLFDRLPPHLVFTVEEEARGQAGLRAMGIPEGAPFVCLSVRDGAYGEQQTPLVDVSYHDYRNCDIGNFRLAAEALAERGFFVIRVGARVREPLLSSHPRILDYATNGMRSEFLDIYLAAKCAFCVATTAGFFSVPLIFRRPIAFANWVPLGWLHASGSQLLSIAKRHYSVLERRELTLSEIVARGLGALYDSHEYEANGIRLIENTPEEIRDLVHEMVERLAGTWRPHGDDDALQARFWEGFPTTAVSAENRRPLHGEMRGRFGAAYLRNNRWWLQ